MNNPVIQALSYGQAFAEVLKERLEDGLTDALSDIGKFDAERSQWFQDFSKDVQARADQRNLDRPVTINIDSEEAEVDLQEMIDELRAEIASLKAELKQYQDQAL